MLGVKVTLPFRQLIVPEIGPEPESRKLAVLTLVQSMSSLKVTLSWVSIATPSATGVFENTVGAVVSVGAGSATAAVVKLQARFAASALPTASVMPPVRVTVYTVPVGPLFRAGDGVKVTTLPLQPTLPLIAPLFTRKLALVTLAQASGSEKAAVTTLLAATPVAPSAGVVEVTDFGSSYARTLSAWLERFDLAWPVIADLGFDERFRRMWRYYLAYCEAGFKTGRISVQQWAFES